MEAATNQATKQPRPASGPRFGAGIDPREAGRRGGVASGVSRRLRPFRELESKIASTRNGAAIYALYRTRLERDQALERERIRMDRVVNQLMDWTEEERATLEQLRAERNALLEHSDALRSAITAAEAELVDRLRTLHEAGGLVSALVALDLFDAVDDEPSEATS